MLLLTLAMAGLLTISYFIIKDSNDQIADIDDDDDPTTTCWEDDDYHPNY